MRISKRSRSRGGFTLTEVLITVAIIGVLAALAIPNFLTYQARARRSEGFMNVAGIVSAYKAYHAESGRFPDMVVLAGEATLPDPSDHGMPAPSTRKLPWDTKTEDFFKTVGWQAEGEVFFTYDVKSDACGNACTDATCFTVTAHGDVDGNGVLSALMYVHPLRDPSGTVLASCTDAVFGYGPPIRGQGGAFVTVYDEAAVRQGEPY